MAVGLTLMVNGVERTFAELSNGMPVSSLVRALGFREDRVALERNGEIVPRAGWADAQIHDDDRFEVVHFVGGGSTSSSPADHR